MELERRRPSKQRHDAEQGLLGGLQKSDALVGGNSCNQSARMSAGLNQHMSLSCSLFVMPPSAMLRFNPRPHLAG